MISFFPTPYPDELLYSTLARYYIKSANVSPKVALAELFGATTVIATFDLPSHLESLVSNLPLLSGHTVENFTERHTLFPLYAPFLSPERALLVCSSMRHHFHGDIHARVGIMASSMPIYSHFRFCSICFREEIKEYGESYWHRLHQVPGILVCPIHYVSLQQSAVKTAGVNRHEFYAASQENCLSKPVPVKYSNDTFNKLILLARDAETLINISLEPKTGEWYRGQYQKILIDRGLATESGRVRQKELLSEFTAFYGMEFLKAVHSEIENDTESNWLSDIVRKHRKTFHPIRHLLLIRFLGQTIESFFSHDYTVKPFGDSPWKCFNGASNHYLKKVIKSVSVSYSHDAKKLIGTFSCHCGFIYSTSDPMVPYSDKLGRGKIKSFGGVWEQKIRELLVEEKVSFRKAARNLKVDTNTVIYHAKRLNLISSNKIFTDKNAEFLTRVIKVKKEENRKIWLNLRKSNSTLSKTGLRRKLPGVYMWLYRNDRKWLIKNSPGLKNVILVNRRVDWSERDGQTLIQVKNVVEKLLTKEPPVRVTISAVGKAVNLRALFEKHLNKLPYTALFLATHIESVEEFQIRRVKWTARELLKHGQSPKSWLIMRLAGIKKNCTENVMRAVNDQLHPKNEHFYTYKGKRG